jgi:predicted RNase H-like HicB family nuclease
MRFPDQFSILIREEKDGLFVGTIEELPDVSAFEDSYREAWEILVDAICTLKEMNDEQG